MIDVSLLVCACAMRFFFKSDRILFLSHQKRMKTTNFSMKARRLAVSKASPRISPTRMKKKMVRIRPTFSERSAYGRII